MLFKARMILSRPGIGWLGVLFSAQAVLLGCPGAEPKLPPLPPAPEPQISKCQDIPSSQFQTEKGGVMMSDGQQQDTLIDAQQGTVVELGESRIGIGTVLEKEALLAVSSKVAGVSRLIRMTVCGGEIVPIGGKFYHIVYVSYSQNTNPPGYVGGSRSRLAINPTPIELEGLELHFDSLAIPLDASAKTVESYNSGHNIEVLELTDSTAKLETWPNKSTRPDVKQSHSVKAGDKLNLDSLQLTILSVVPSNPQTGLRGFVEIGF